MEALSEQQIVSFIAQLKDDLVTADKFLAMWRRRNQVPAPIPKKEAEQPVLPHTNGTTANASSGAEYGEIANKVRAAIVKCPKRYSINDVESSLRALGHAIDRDTLSQCLGRMARAGKLLVHKKGAGRRATIFKKEEATTTQERTPSP